MDADRCVLCGSVIPEGSHVCGKCKREIDRPPEKGIACSVCPDEDTDVCRRCLKYGGG